LGEDDQKNLFAIKKVKKDMFNPQEWEASQKVKGYENFLVLKKIKFIEKARI
jgi:hypothetical protein